MKFPRWILGINWVDITTHNEVMQHAGIYYSLYRVLKLRRLAAPFTTITVLNGAMAPFPPSLVPTVGICLGHSLGSIANFVLTTVLVPGADWSNAPFT